MANVQICDVLVTFNPKTKVVAVRWPKDDLAQTEQLAKALSAWAQAAVENASVKAAIGQSYGFDKKGFDASIKRLTKTSYKVCFHAKTVDEDPR